MPRQGHRGVMMEGLMVPTKIRKRGCSSSSSSSSRIYNYRLNKRAILVGKNRAGIGIGLGRSRSSTPVPTWRTTPLRSAIDSPKYSQSGKSTRPVSARRLAATLWEMNEMPSPKMSESNLELMKRQQKKNGSKMVLKREKMQSGWGLHSGSGSLPPHLSDPSHSPTVSEKMDRSGTGSRRRRTPSISQRLVSADQNVGVIDSISNASLMEHRFYGKSMPFGGSKEIAYSNSSTLGYLSSTQALADYATLILDLKKNLTATDSPVVVFGGSYGGMLAAWFRLKYPHVAVGALASSAPILNFDNITSPFSFNNIITQDFRSESENCYKVIKRSWQEIEDTAAKPGGLEILRKSFRICKNYISRGSLEGWLGTAYTYTAMTDYPTPTNFLNPLPAYPVKQMCKAIDDPKTGNNTFEKLYGAANIYYNYTGEAKCFDLIDDSDPHGLGGWTWQACTEMILLTDGNTEDSIFPASNYSYNDRVEFCNYKYNIEPRPSWIPTEFGAHHIHRVLKRFGSNIIFFNGLRDPWSGGGVLKDISKSVVAIVAKEGAHHVDLRFSTNEDPEWLQDVRKREVHIISKWLSQYYHTLADSPKY